MACANHVKSVKAKFDKVKELVKSQIELKRLIKRNQKDSEGVNKVSGRKRGPKSNKKAAKQDKKRVCKIPFIVVKYCPDKSQPDFPMKYHKKRVQLTSELPLKCYGDSTILSKMKLHEISPDETLVDMLGPIGN